MRRPQTPGVPGTHLPPPRPAPRDYRRDAEPPPAGEIPQEPETQREIPREQRTWRPSRHNAPQWATGIIAVVGALGGVGGLVQLIQASGETTKTLARIEAKVDAHGENQKELSRRISVVETWSRNHHTRAEVFYAVTSGALKLDGIDVGAGVDDAQIAFSSTQNKKKPVQATGPDGLQIEIPQAVPPPQLK